MSYYDPGSEPSKIVRETRLFESAPDRIGESDKLKFNLESDISDWVSGDGKDAVFFVCSTFFISERGAPN